MLSSSFLTSEPSLVKSLLKKVLPILSKPFLKGALQMRSYKKKKNCKASQIPVSRAMCDLPKFTPSQSLKGRGNAQIY